VRNLSTVDFRESLNLENERKNPRNIEGQFPLGLNRVSGFQESRGRVACQRNF
jgi:hypothetical protein